jgi:hypothetical protein
MLLRRVYKGNCWQRKIGYSVAEKLATKALRL